MRKLFIAALLLVSFSAFAQMHHAPQQMGPMQVTVSLDGSLVLFTSIKAADKAELVALNAATGTKAWSLQLDAAPMSITPGQNAFYLVLVKVSPETRTATRTLVAVNASGVVVWTKPIV